MGFVVLCLRRVPFTLTFADWAKIEVYIVPSFNSPYHLASARPQTETRRRSSANDEIEFDLFCYSR